MKKALVLTGIIALLLYIAPVLATYSTSFVYTAFNSETATYKALDTTYATWSAKLTNVLTYNATESGTATIRLNSTATENSYIDACFNQDLTCDIWWSDNGTSAVKIGSGTFVKSEAVYVSRDSKGYLDFGNSTDKDAFISNFVVGALTLEDIGGLGSAGVGDVQYVATTGYISVEIGISSTDPTDMTASIMDWMPLVVQFAMLGMVMGMLKKYGKL